MKWSKAPSTGHNAKYSDLCGWNPTWEREGEKEAEEMATEIVAGVFPKIDKANQNIDARDRLSLRRDKYRENKI